MNIKVNTNKNNFIYNCEIFPRTGESIVYKNHYYKVRDIYYHVNIYGITTIEVDAEFRGF